MKKILLFLICLTSIPSTAQDSIEVQNHIAVADTSHNVQGKDKLIVPKVKRSQLKHRRSRFKIQPLLVIPYDSIICRDSVFLSKVEEYVAEMSTKTDTIKGIVDKSEKQIDELKEHIAYMYILMWAILAILIVCALFAVMAVLKLRCRTPKETPSLIENSVDELNHDNIVTTSPIAENEVPQLSDADVVAYNDAIQAFVNIDNYIYDLKKHNALITPWMMWLASDCPKPNVVTSSLPDEERTKVSLLVSKIEQFKNNHEQAINRYLIRSKSQKTFEDCVRCPLKGSFNSELDQHLLGEDLEDGEEIRSVYKMGYHFPDSKAYPYREKSLIL